MRPRPLNEMSASELARGLAQREWRAEDVLNACLDRIAERETLIGAWEYLAADAALDAARELDRGAVRGLLHGLPLGIKDIIDTADMPTGLGSPIYSNNRPRSDAAVVASCRGQGAIMLGKTVTTEMATALPSRTRNPLRPTHTPGGSSSGSAAAVADYMVPLALGTQTAASLVRPAAYCGIVGFKPSLGKLARAGVKSQCETMDTVGALARTVADAALLVAAMSGDRRLLELDSPDVPRFGLCRTPEWEQAGADTRQAMELAASGLAAAGAATRALAPPALDGLSIVQAEIMLFEAAHAYAWERQFQRELLSPGLRQMLDTGLAISHEQHERNLARAELARAAIASAFDEVDVIIAPSTTGEAPAGLESTGDPLFCRQWSLLGLPCVHVPFTSGASGMPVGLQVIARHGHDRDALRAAQFMQQRLAQA
ncbi:MAG: amidase [Paucimonas sp.]|nr:amidase [Paucimonas sp.]